MTTIYKDQDGKTIRIDKGTQPRSVVPVISKSTAKREAALKPSSDTGAKPVKKEQQA